MGSILAVLIGIAHIGQTQDQCGVIHMGLPSLSLCGIHMGSRKETHISRFAKLTYTRDLYNQTDVGYS